MHVSSERAPLSVLISVRARRPNCKPENAPGGTPLSRQGAEPEKSFKDVLSEKINEVNNLQDFVDKCVAFRNSYVEERGPAFAEMYERILAVQ